MKSGAGKKSKQEVYDFIREYLQYIFTERRYFYTVLKSEHKGNFAFTKEQYLKTVIPEKYINDKYISKEPQYSTDLDGIQNVHAIPLSADEDRWFAGAWHILLPNLMVLGIVTNPRVHLRLNTSDAGMLRIEIGLWLSKNQALRNIMHPGLDAQHTVSPSDVARYFAGYKDMYFSEPEANVLSTMQNTLEKMKPLINLHIMCKIAEERLEKNEPVVEKKEWKERNNNIRNLLTNMSAFVFTLIPNTFDQTLSNPKENSASRNQPCINEDNSFMCLGIDDTSIKSLEAYLKETGSENTYFGRSLIALATAMKNQDEKAILQLFKLTSQYNAPSPSAPQNEKASKPSEKEQIDPNISEKSRGKEAEEPERRRSMVFSSKDIKSPVESEDIKPPVESKYIKSPVEEHIDELTDILIEEYKLSQETARTLAENATNSDEGNFSDRDQKLFQRIEKAFDQGRDIEDVINDQFREIASPSPKRR